MLKIGVTGGIGSGKTLVCRVFSKLGAPVYNSDVEARRIMYENKIIMQKLKEAFGQQVFKEGRPDRRALANLVFVNREALDRINEIVHPAVEEDFISWMKEYRNMPYIVIESAILFETGIYKQLDTVIHVSAPEKLRIERVILRDGADEQSIKQRIYSQWPDEKKEALSGQVINNDNTHPILSVIIQLHSEFSRGCLRKEMIIK